MLIIDHYVPEPDRDAGSRVAVAVLEVLTRPGWLVKFWPDNRQRTPYSAALERMGVEVIDQSCPLDFAGWMALHGADLDHIMVTRPTVALNYMAHLEAGTSAFLSFSGADIHHMRMLREAELTGNAALHAEAMAMKRLEMRLWRRFDSLLYPSEEEAQAIRELVPSAPAYKMVSFCFGAPLSARMPASGHDILFVGGFAHPPNVDAALWLVNEILPLVRTRIPDVTLTLAGSNPALAVRALAGADVTVTGFVTDARLAELYAEHRVAAVPLRFGAGVKGKVVEALHHGLPIVTTPIGAEGIDNLPDAASIAAETAAFADALVALLQDDGLWQARSEAGTALVQENFSRKRLAESLFHALGEITPADALLD